MKGFERTYRYSWPTAPLADTPGWRREAGYAVRDLPESLGELRADSRWPALFPAAVCLVSTGDGRTMALERVVGVSIVNRFPYVMAVSVCRVPLSERHYARRRFMEVVERSRRVAVQFLPPGTALDRALDAVAALPDEQTGLRITRSGLAYRSAATGPMPVFAAAHLVYEGALVRPGQDQGGQPIFAEPWRDVGSHRLYFFEVRAIQLRRDIAEGSRQIAWTGLPTWQAPTDGTPANSAHEPAGPYTKAYTPHYRFPSASTVAFAAERHQGGMAIRQLPPAGCVEWERDNDRARWPCFFPSSVGLIATWADDGQANVMPCGSTTVVSRQPFTIACAVSSASINERYAKRATLAMLRRTGRFGCGVPFLDAGVVAAIRYAGNVSHDRDAFKVANAGLAVQGGGPVPLLRDLPIQFDCRVVGEQHLGTHVLFLGEVERVRVRADVTPDNPLEWCPFAAVETANARAGVTAA